MVRQLVADRLAWVVLLDGGTPVEEGDGRSSRSYPPRYDRDFVPAHTPSLLFRCNKSISNSARWLGLVISMHPCTWRCRGQCDEYPFASSVEGGAGAQEQEVPALENQCQGGTINAAYRREGITDGERYVVILFHTELIPTGPFTGDDIAKDKSACPT
jgi:Deoxyribonuclease NucA/NucB